MQKPVLNLIEDVEVAKAAQENLKSAIYLAVLLQFHRLDEVPLFDLFLKLCNFSYKGDVRMKWKMENPNKVSNLVSGSYEGLVELYLPFLRDLEA